MNVETIASLTRPTGLPFSLNKIGHVALFVTELERSARFYVEVLGFRVTDVYGPRNGYRMAPYHRLDLAATLHPSPRSSWTFGVYNAYNRLNPYFIYFGNSGDPATGTLDIAAYQVSLFPVLPSVSYNFSF